MIFTIKAKKNVIYYCLFRSRFAHSGAWTYGNIVCCSPGANKNVEILIELLFMNVTRATHELH